VSILRNESKAPLFSVEDRMQMLSEAVSPYKNVEVDCFDGLPRNLRPGKGRARHSPRIRAISDYEYERKWP